jgi:hypothetical protein
MRFGDFSKNISKPLDRMEKGGFDDDCKNQFAAVKKNKCFNQTAML